MIFKDELVKSVLLALNCDQWQVSQSIRKTLLGQDISRWFLRL